MKIVVVISRNLMDLSKIREAAKASLNDVITCQNHSKVISMMSAGAGDRKFKVIFDYFLYPETGLEQARNKIEDTAIKYRIQGTEYLSFAPHESIKEIQSLNPGVEIVPRSKFFLDIEKHLE